MFIHVEDQTEVQGKIFDDGSLVICCPNCKTVWSTILKVIRKGGKAVETYGAEEILLGWEARTERIPLAHLNLKDIIVSSEMKGKENQQKMLISAEKAFPEAFGK